MAGVAGVDAGLRKVVASERLHWFASELPGERAGRLTVEVQVEVFAEDLDVAQARSIDDVVPDRRERRRGTVGEIETSHRDVVDSGVAVDLPDRAVHTVDGTAQPLHDVDVVDRVLQQRAAACAGGVDPPVRAVVALDRNELIVAKRHREQATGALIGEQRLGVQELWHEPQDQTDLTRDLGSFDGVDHSLGRRSVDRERLFAEHGNAVFCCGCNQMFVLGRPRGHERRVHAIEQVVLGDDVSADATSERLSPIVVEIVDGHDLVIGGSVFEEPVVGSRDETRADETDANRHCVGSAQS